MTGKADPCPISRTVRLIGGRWTPLVLREILFGRRRIEEIQSGPDVSRATLADRLRRLVDDGLIERHQHGEHPPRYEYRISRKGRDLSPVYAAMRAYGSNWLFDEPTPGMLIDRETGNEIKPMMIDVISGEPIDLQGTRLVARP